MVFSLTPRLPIEIEKLTEYFNSYVYGYCISHCSHCPKLTSLK